MRDQSGPPRALALGVALVAVLGCSTGAAPTAPPTEAEPTTRSSVTPSSSADATATPGPSPTGSGIAHPTGANELVLRIAVGGGLAGPGLATRTVPAVSLYGDGRLIREGPVPAVFPGAALPNLQVSRITPAGMQRILVAAADAGLMGGDRHLDLLGIFDAHTTTFTVRAGGGEHMVSAYALGLESGLEDRLSPQDAELRRGLVAFQAALTDARWLGPDLHASGLPYVFEELRLFAMPTLPVQDPEVPVQELHWPLPTPLGEVGTPYPMGEGARCVTLAGEDLGLLLPHLRAASESTRWRSGGDLYQLVARPLLPDEHGCPER